MKKFILLILLFLLYIPLFVNAETCDTDKISISSITIESKSDSVEELDEATANGKSIILNLSMSNVGDNIEYKIVVKNDSNEDYELDKNSFNLSSDYIEYTLDTEDNTNIVKANSSKVVSLKVNYANELPDDAFESGTYNDNKSMTLNLSTGDIINVPDTLKNQNTGVQSYILILFLILLISITAYVILKKKKYAKFMILIYVSVIIVPMSVYALCKCEIKIESSITINKKVFEIIDGDINNLITGDKLLIGQEEFYVISSEKNANTILLGKYNLKVGNIYDSNLNKIGEFLPSDDYYGIQSNEFGGVKYTDKNIFLDNYKNYLIHYFNLPEDSYVRLITLEELMYLGCNSNYTNWPNGDTCKQAPDWVTSTSYWTQSLYSNSGPSRFCVWTTSITAYNVNKDYYFGIRPVLVVKTSDIENK